MWRLNIKNPPSPILSLKGEGQFAFDGGTQKPRAMPWVMYAEAF